MNNYDRTDVVFVIEKSISLKRYLPELLEAYISPTISCFGGGLSEDSDVFFNQSSLVQYGGVFYGTELSLLGSWGQVESFGPTCSEREIFSAINNARYTCKNLTRQAFILEGLQAAVNLFEKMKLHSPMSENIQRCCILITQSTPMSNPWSPVSAEKVLLEFKRIGIQLSIISAHKLVELYRLFDAAGGDYQANPAKNYASKPQHLVLLNGVTSLTPIAPYSLQERALSPSLITTYVPGTNGATPPTTMSTAPAAVTVPPTAGPGPSPGTVPGTTTPSPRTAAESPVPQPVGMVRSQVPMVSQPQNATPINPNPQPPVGRLRTPTVIGPNRPRWPVDTVVPANPGGAPTWPGGSNGRPVMIVNPNQPGLNQPGLIQDGLIGKVQQPGIPNVDISTNLPSIQQQQPMPGPSVPGAQTPAQGMNMTNQRTVVWQGTLEWQEKKNDNNSRVVHQVTCKMTSLNVNGEPEVKAEGWPPTLIMQMIPKNILGSIGNMFFKNVKTVMFMPDQSPALDVLTAFLIKGMAGCVHVSHTGTTQQNDVKVIILLFSGEKKAYVGFIPVDQLSFVNKIKTVIQSARRGQPNAMMPTATGANVTQPVQSLPGMIVPSNPNMQPIQTNAGTGMNVMSTQPQSMIIQQNPQLTQALNQPLNQGIGGGQQMPPLTVTQGMGQPGQGNVNVPLGNPGQNVLQPRTPLGMQQQQTDQEKMQILQIRQSQQQHTQAIRQQLQQQLQHKPGITNVSMNIGQQGTGANTCPTMGQPRMLQPSMQNPGLRQLLQQQVRLQQQQQQVQHQQQHPQQQQILMMQQQGIRPQLTQQGQQVLGQPLNQQNMGQPTMGQQNLGQQAMNPQGIGQSIQDSTDYMVDLL
ncbi:mediator of RNA polymerase II transcription subunit 25-like isoform X3 [Macrobrachium nipponense]|uniref:mediator of RNA polymerase II transcription subunit 25-like isoform X3 n=1 Tax=Macrobrachium nipponense TaxID=159736 RepID=UPI0030C840A2